MSRVAVSILNHNSAPGTIACVQSLLVAAAAVSGTCQLDIFVADNASGSEEQHQLWEFLGELANTHFQANDRNLGFAAGHNRNLQIIFSQSSPDYIWLLNSDCLVAEETLRALIESAQQNPAVGIWGATLLEPGGETIQCAGGCFYNAWISSYRQYGQGKSLAQLEQLEPVDFDYIAGASLFFPVATLQNGLRSAPAVPPAAACADTPQWLNESFFLYFEELDLVQRLQPGFALAWCKKALIRHAGGASTGTGDNQRTELAEYHSTLSALKFTRLYYPQRMWFVVPVRYLSKCLQLLVKGEFRLLGPLTRAYRDYWSG